MTNGGLLKYDAGRAKCFSTLAAHLVAQRAYGAGLEPSLDAVEVEHVAAAAERDRQAVLVVRRWVCLFEATVCIVAQEDSKGCGSGPGCLSLSGVPGPESDMHQP